MSLHTNLTSSPRAFPHCLKSTSYWISHNSATTNGSTKQTRQLAPSWSALHDRSVTQMICNFNQGVNTSHVRKPNKLTILGSTRWGLRGFDTRGTIVPDCEFVSLHTNLISSPRAFPHCPKSTSYWITTLPQMEARSKRGTRSIMKRFTRFVTQMICNFNQGVSAPRITSLQNIEVGIKLKVMQDPSAGWWQ